MQVEKYIQLRLLKYKKLKKKQLFVCVFMLLTSVTHPIELMMSVSHKIKGKQEKNWKLHSK